MTDPSGLLAKLVAALKTNTTLVTLLGGAANISSYEPTYPTAVNAAAAIQRMNPPSILIAWTGTLCNDRINGIEHQYSIFLCPSGAFIPLFVAIREGVVTTDVGTGKLKLTQLTTLTHPPDVRGCYPRSIVVGEAFFEYYEVPIRITDRGTDN